MTAETFDALARQAIDLSQRALLVHMRFLNAAFSRLSLLPVSGATLATDGAHLRYDPASFARAYAADSAEAAHALLHVLLHNVFLHPFVAADVDALRWDAACDIAVELAIAELDVPPARTPVRSSRQRAALARIEGIPAQATAEMLYRFLLDANLPDADVEALRTPFLFDDHEPWHRAYVEEGHSPASTAEKKAEEGTGGASAPAAGAGDSGTDIDIPDEAADAKRSHASHRGLPPEDIMQKAAPEHAAPSAGERFADTVNLDRSRDQWKNAALEMGVQLDAYAKLWGAQGANLAMNLRAVTREKHDYRAFLRKFARMGEQMRVNDDEFDYVYYCYGLARYGNLPLIEPLEYAEEKRIRDFVIAIDTSASTKDGLVRRFIEKTYSILSDETSFFAQMNALIIQCDAAIANVTRVSSVRDLETYLDDLTIKGLGGTDFRPVFVYVDDCLERGELQNLAGVIYFTDGQGTFPSRKPAYDTAFVFVDDADDIQVPVWAMKVVLEETALLEA